MMPADPSTLPARPRPYPTPPSRALKSPHPGPGGCHLHPAGPGAAPWLPAARVRSSPPCSLACCCSASASPGSQVSEAGRRPEGRARTRRGRSLSAGRSNRGSRGGSEETHEK